jgi:sugar phosphate isomerase/epimerase
MSALPLAVVLSLEETDFSAVTFTGGLAEVVDRIAALGYKGVELAVRNPATVDVEGLEAVLARAGVRAAAVGTGQAYLHDGLALTSPDGEVRSRALRRLESHIALAERLNALVIVGLLRGGPLGAQPRAEAYEHLVDGLREASVAARRHGVRLALEAINRYETGLVHTCEQGLTLLDAVGADNVGLLLDTFHMNIEERSIEVAIMRAGSHLFHFHVADSNRLHPGGGHVDFGAALAALRAIGYSGFVSGEFMPQPDPATAARRAVEHLRATGLVRA